MKKSLPFFLFLIAQAAIGQITLLTDMCKVFDAGGLLPKEIIEVNGTLYFTGDSEVGVELWKSDGTAAGTVLVKDILKGAVSSRITNLVQLDGVIYFFAASKYPWAPLELWRSDGTEAGTTLVYDFGLNSSVGRLLVAGNRLYFANSFTAANNYDLWSSDGTTAGTNKLLSQVDLNSDGNGNIFQATFQGLAYFSVRTEGQGYELWQSDGTVAGTRMVKDIVPGNIGSGPYEFTRYHQSLYFIAYNGALNGLWKTDGTEAGTVMIGTFSGTGTPRYLRVVNDQLMVTAQDGTDWWWWKSDGTPGNLAKVITLVRQPSQVIQHDNSLFYTYATTSGFTITSYLWKTDGSVAGTQQVRTFTGTTGTMYDAGDRFYLYAYPDGTTDGGLQLWASDGTTAGSRVLTQGITSSRPSGPLAMLGHTAHFAMNVPTSGTELWKTDGTVAGTQVVLNRPEGNLGGATTVVNEFTRVNDDVVVFTTRGETGNVEAWRTDGTEGGTYSLAPNAAGTLGASSNYTVYHGYVYFTSGVAGAGGIRGLWRTDGTREGTRLFKELPLSTLPNPSMLYVFQDKLFFVANKDDLWYTDGTEAGTRLVKDFGSLTINSIVTVGDYMYLLHNNNTLWKTDGTSAGTVQVKSGLSAKDLALAGGKIFLGGYNDMWVSDGTEAGTRLLKQFNTVLVAPEAAVSTSQYLFFLATDLDQHGGLWRTNGTEAGTVLVTDKRFGVGNLSENNLAQINNTVYFDGYSALGGELWKTDGTAAGTMIVKDIAPGTVSAAPGSFEVAGDYLYFVATDGNGDRQLWKTNGKTCGTVAVASPNPAAFSPGHSPTVIGHTMFILAEEKLTGQEIYVYDVRNDPAIPDGCRVGQSLVFTALTDQVMGAVPVALQAWSTSSLPVAFSVLAGHAQVDGQSLVLQGPGLCRVRASQPGGAAYEPAESVERQFCIHPVKPEISLQADPVHPVLHSSQSQGNQWYKDGEPLAGATAETFTAAESGSYTVQTTVEGCASERSAGADIVIKVVPPGEVTGIDDGAAHVLALYPNPASERLTIQLQDNREGREFRIIGNTGQAFVYQKTMSFQDGVDISGLPPGLYTVQFVTTAGQTVASKFVKR